jgi:hypothetical protein
MSDLIRFSVEEAKKYIRLSGSPETVCSKAIGFTLTPSLQDGWEDVTYYGEGTFDPSFAIRSPEWVYVLVNQNMPGICKIGMTTTSVAQRVEEINSATGVITPWYPVYSYKCINSYYLEQEVHTYLEKRGYRVNPKREGFLITSTEAIRVIEELGEKYRANLNESSGSYYDNTIY